MTNGKQPLVTGSAHFDALLVGVQPDEAPTVPDASSWLWSAQIPGAARSQGVRAACREYLVRYAVADDEALANAELIIAELVANVERHAPGPASFHLDWNGRHPRLMVMDRGPGFAAEPATTLENPWSESGRGLAIVALLAVEYHFGNRIDGGGYVCVVLPVERAEHESARELGNTVIQPWKTAPSSSHCGGTSTRSMALPSSISPSYAF